MIFSTLFEIGLFILGLLYVGDMYFDSVLHLIEIGNDITEKEKEEQNDKELQELTQHIYAWNGGKNRITEI